MNALVSKPLERRRAPGTRHARRPRTKAGVLVRTAVRAFPSLGRRARVLLVGRASQRREVRSLLREAGIRRVAGALAKRALRRMSEDIQAVVITVPLTGQSATQLCRRIRDAGFDQPVFLLCARRPDVHAVHELEVAGITATVAWPGERPALVRALARVVDVGDSIAPKDVVLEERVRVALDRDSRVPSSDELDIRARDGVVFVDGDAGPRMRDRARRLIETLPNARGLVLQET